VLFCKFSPPLVKGPCNKIPTRQIWRLQRGGGGRGGEWQIGWDDDQSPHRTPSSWNTTKDKSALTAGWICHHETKKSQWTSRISAPGFESGKQTLGQYQVLPPPQSSRLELTTSRLKLTCHRICTIKGQLHVVIFSDAKNALNLSHKVVVGALAVRDLDMVDLHTFCCIMGNSYRFNYAYCPFPLPNIQWCLGNTTFLIRASSPFSLSRTLWHLGCAIIAASAALWNRACTEGVDIHEHR